MYKCALVLEGGGNRAIYTSGVLDAFMEKGVEFPYVIGVSAGSCNGVSYIAKCKKRQHDIAIKYANDKRYMGIGNLIKNGEYLNREWIFGELSYDISPLDQEAYERSKTTFCVVATNALTGKAEYFYPKSFRERGCVEIKASCSLPIATKGTPIGGQMYFDGGLADSIPLERAFADGCKKAVVILTQHKSFRKQPMPQKSAKLIKKYPMIGEDIQNRHIMYNHELDFVAQAQKDGKALVIQPNTPLMAKTLEKDLSKLESIYNLGYTQGLRRAEEVKKFINEE